MTSQHRAAAVFGLLLAAAATAALLRPSPRFGLPPSPAVVDMRGAVVPIRLPFARAALLFPPSIDDVLVSTGRPDLVGAAQALNRTALRHGLLARFYPGLAGSIIFLPGDVGQAPDVETLLRLQPSVVLSRASDAPRLRQLGLPALGIENTQDERWLVGRARMALQAEGLETRLATLVSSERDGMASVAAAVGNAAGQASRVLLLASFGGVMIGDGDRMSIASGPLEIAGGQSVLGPVLALHLDRERLLRLNPDMIVLLNTWPPGPARDEFASAPAFRSLRAVATRRVYRIIPGLEFLPDGLASWPLLARWLAELLHPDLPSTLRDDVRATCRRWTGITMTEADLDEALAVVDNRGAADAARFERR